MSGTLYIVATPIGNLKDLSGRALEVLQLVDLIAAEDTRHSAKLLQYYGVETKMLSLHEYNENQQYKKIIDLLKQNKSIALISDAGTPLISDPGYRLVHEARQEKIDVIPIPGACALVAALSVSGLPSNRFCFEGFLPPKKTSRLKTLVLLQHEERTLIFYEAPHRIIESLQDMMKTFGAKREVVVARELTKRFETIHGGSIEELVTWIKEHPQEQQGEFVIVVSGKEKTKEQALTTDDLKILEILLKELSVKQASQLAAKITGKSKNAFYKVAVAG